MPLLIVISRFQCMQQRAKRTDTSNLIKVYSCERVGEAGVPVVLGIPPLFLSLNNFCTQLRSYLFNNDSLLITLERCKRLFRLRLRRHYIARVTSRPYGLHNRSFALVRSLMISFGNAASRSPRTILLFLFVRSFQWNQTTMR